MKAFLAELKRRNVAKVSLTYLVVAWLLLQAMITVRILFDLPGELVIALAIVLFIVFTVVVFISWSFEATPDGLKRTGDITPGTVLPTWSYRKFITFIAIVSLLAAGLLVFDLLR